MLEEFDDYLTCEGYDPNTGKYFREVAVAKPYLLRKTPFDGESVTFGDMTVSYAEWRKSRRANKRISPRIRPRRLRSRVRPSVSYFYCSAP